MLRNETKNAICPRCKSKKSVYNVVTNCLVCKQCFVLHDGKKIINCEQKIQDNLRRYIADAKKQRYCRICGFPILKGQLHVSLISGSNSYQHRDNICKHCIDLLKKNLEDAALNGFQNTPAECEDVECCTCKLTKELKIEIDCPYVED